MKVSFEAPDKINGLLTITVEEDDYKEDVEKALKEYRKKANVPGFRPGQVPMGMIKRQFGSAIKMDAVNKLLGNEIEKYISENNIQMLGEPLGSEKQEAQDLEAEPPYTFMFDIAIAPEFKVELTNKDKIDYYDIQVDDELVDKQVKMFAARMGKNVSVEEYQDGDLLKGDMRELDDKGNTKEGGLTVEDAVIMPKYIKVDEQKKIFDGAKKGDIITFNPKKAYPDSVTEMAALLKVKKEEAGQYAGDFSYQITNIDRMQDHAVDQELFDQVYGAGNVKDEKDFRAKIADGLKKQLERESNYKFLLDLRKYVEDKVGALTYPDALLKRMLKQRNADKDEAAIEKNYELSLKELSWDLMRGQLAEQLKVKVNDDDVKNAAMETARMQFAQYGMNDVPEMYVEQYAEKLIEKEDGKRNFVNRAVDVKVMEAAKPVVKLNKKKISLDDFQKMTEE
ncbi:peptidylprolyl isomerase [Prevotella sp. S7-1-8]|uniref:trigger factor n=1 Tax=Prevotella sp. S7-1-8 TaxID=1284775 RepID=UPI00050F2895|nr:trigger factor [Prevotella sp. S7-1-8]KGF18259.1 peptidylprolyl isomerase [Prevotella sp. S7-1-8]